MSAFYFLSDVNTANFVSKLTFPTIFKVFNTSNFFHFSIKRPINLETLTVQNMIIA